MTRFALPILTFLYFWNPSASYCQQGAFKLNINRGALIPKQSDRAEELAEKRGDPDYMMLYQLKGKQADRGAGHQFAGFYATDSVRAGGLQATSIGESLKEALRKRPSVWSNCILSPQIGIEVRWVTGEIEQYLVASDCNMIFKYSGGKARKYSMHLPSIQNIVSVYEAALQSFRIQQGNSSKGQGQWPSSQEAQRRWQPSLLPKKRKP